MGASLAAQQGQAQAAAAAGAAQRRQQVGQMQMLEKRREQDAALFERKREIETRARQLESSLGRMDSSLKQNVIDRQLQFREDELGRTAFNQRQLADWAVTQAKSAEEFKNYKQMVQQESEKKMTMLRVAQAKIKQELQQEYQKESARADRDLQLRLTKAKAAIDEKIRKEQAEAANRAMLWNGIGTLAGAGIAAAALVAAAPTGGLSLAAAAPLIGMGATLGGAGGSLAAGATTPESSVSQGVNIREEMY